MHVKLHESEVGTKRAHDLVFDGSLEMAAMVVGRLTEEAKSATSTSWPVDGDM